MSIDYRVADWPLGHHIHLRPYDYDTGLLEPWSQVLSAISSF